MRIAVLASLLAASWSMSAEGVAAERLNIKTGLWEIKSTTQSSGLPPLSKELRDRMTPAQLERMAADMKARAAKGPSHETARECITDKDLANPFSAGDAKQCRQKVVTSTRTQQEAHIVCEGEQQAAGVLKVNTPTPETMTGSFDLKMGDGADPFIIKGTMTGRWLGADCGDEGESDADGDDDDTPADDSEEER